MTIGAYVCGWYTKADADLGRIVTNDVIETVKTNSLAYTTMQPYWSDADGSTGEPLRGAVVMLVDAPDATHKSLSQLPNNEVVPVSPNNQQVSSIASFLSAKGVIVDLTTATTRRDVTGRVVRALDSRFVDFPAAYDTL